MEPETIQLVGLIVDMIMLTVSIVSIAVSCYDRNKVNKYVNTKEGISEENVAPSTPAPLQHVCPGFVHNDHHHKHRDHHKGERGKDYKNHKHADHHRLENLGSRSVEIEIPSAPSIAGENYESFDISIVS